MRMLGPSRVGAYVGLILFVGCVARAPGLFWGYHLFGAETVILHSDEPPGRAPTTAYARGLEAHFRSLIALLDVTGLRRPESGEAGDLLVGRGLALVYGVLTIAVVFRLAAAVFKDDRVGLLAALFLSLADLHVTYSHIGTADAPAAFWFYAALASAHTALERGSRPAALLSAVCTGAGAAMRPLAMAAALPLAWWALRSRPRTLDGLLLLLIASTAFILFNGFSLYPRALGDVIPPAAGASGLGLEWVRLPAIYLGVLLVGVGLPVFLLAGYGLIRFAGAKRRALRGWRQLLADNEIAVCLAALGAFVLVSTISPWTHRHAVILVPFVAMFAAYGFTRLPCPAWGPFSAQVSARALLGLIAIYLGVQVASVQASFVDDPLEKAGRWLRARVPAGEFVSTFWARVPPEYPSLTEWKANYLVLSAQGYRRYLFRDSVPAHLAGRLPPAEQMSGGNPKDARRLQRLFGGELPYRLVKVVRPRFYTPELLLSQALWYSPPHLDDLLIYERPRERERVVDLLTPALRDYLVTLDTGKGWRLEPGQRVRLSVGGQPLGLELGQGISHLFLPRSLVSSPHTSLRISSDSLLPPLPLDFVSRVRPLGQEFVVESLLDGDLMTAGFFQPEVRADGATWRWTSGAGQILLPGPGSSGAWRRLAVHLHGRPMASPLGRSVAMFLNGRKVGETSLPGEEGTVEFPIPAGSFAGDLATLEVVAPTAAPSGAGAGEARRVDVAVHWVRLSRSEGFRRLDQPVTAASAPLRSWRPLFGLGVPYRVEAVSFPSGGLILKGDLWAPVDAGRSAIVLAHGATTLGREHGLYRGLARRLAEKGYWVLSPNFRGYGDSEAPARIASARDLDFTEDLISAITFLQQRVGVMDLTVVGHSFGADVTISLAFRDRRARRVVAISPARRVYERLLNRPGGREVMRDRMVAEMGLKPEQVPLELMESIVVPITIDTYADRPFPRPVLLVDGELEEEADLHFLRDLYRRLQGEKAYVTIPNADHYFGVLREVEERDPVTLGALADVIDSWIREGARWSRAPD